MLLATFPPTLAGGQPTAHAVRHGLCVRARHQYPPSMERKVGEQTCGSEVSITYVWLDSTAASGPLALLFWRHHPQTMLLLRFIGGWGFSTCRRQGLCLCTRTRQVRGRFFSLPSSSFFSIFLSTLRASPRIHLYERGVATTVHWRHHNTHMGWERREEKKKKGSGKRTERPVTNPWRRNPSSLSLTLSSSPCSPSASNGESRARVTAHLRQKGFLVGNQCRLFMFVAANLHGWVLLGSFQQKVAEVVGAVTVDCCMRPSRSIHSSLMTKANVTLNNSNFHQKR